ncbi:MAG: hypothetical protein WC763_05780 [Candidatus Paceibacterota bacterium]
MNTRVSPDPKQRLAIVMLTIALPVRKKRLNVAPLTLRSLLHPPLNRLIAITIIIIIISSSSRNSNSNSTIDMEATTLTPNCAAHAVAIGINVAATTATTASLSWPLTMDGERTFLATTRAPSSA